MWICRLGDSKNIGSLQKPPQFTGVLVLDTVSARQTSNTGFGVGLAVFGVGTISTRPRAPSESSTFGVALTCASGPAPFEN